MYSYNSKNTEHSENNNYQERYHRKNPTENKLVKKINNYNVERIKRGTYDNQQPTSDYFTEQSNDTNKSNGKNSYYIRRNKPIKDDSINNNNNRQNINNNKRIHNIRPTIKTEENDIMRMNVISYYSEKDDKNKGKSTSSYKITKNYGEVLFNNRQNKSKIDDKNIKNMNRIELDGNKNNNGNLIYINSNNNTSIKIVNKSKSNFSNLNLNNDKTDKNDKITMNNRRKNKNELIISGNNMSNNNNINDKNLNEQEYKYSKHSTKLQNNNNLIQMSNFELTYESDKGQRNAYKSYKKDRTINNNTKANNKYKKKSVYYYNINLDNNNIIDDNNETTINKNNNNQNKYKYQIIQYNSTTNTNNNSSNNTLRNNAKKRININDSIEIKDLHNNKSVSLVSSNKGRSLKTVVNDSGPRPMKYNQSNIIKDNENKSMNSKYKYNINNNVIEMMEPNGNSNNNDNIHMKNNNFSNISIENPINITSQSNFSKKNSNNNNFYNNTNNNISNQIKKREVNKKNKNKNYYRKKSDIKKIILIQSIYKGFSLRLKLANQIQLYSYLREFIDFLYYKIYIRKVKYWKYFIEKIINKIAEEINKSKKKSKTYDNNKNNKNKSNQNSLYNTNNKLILKTNEINKLHKELGDSFNIINDNNNGLKLQLDEMIKENKELKNQIFDNKNIEERYQQLLVENKKNQNINSIIMKDNQQLAKKLKNIQDNRNNQLVIQNQSSLNMAYEDNLLNQSLIKLKYLFLKSLIFKKILKIRNIQKKFFTKYRNNVKKTKNYKIENNNIFINNKKKINIQMAPNSTLNFISQNENYKHFLLYKLFLRKEKNQNKIISKYFYNFYYKSKYIKISEIKEEEKKQNETKLIEETKIQKKNLLQSIIDKYERNCDFLCRKTYKEWRLRSVIFKIKGVAKEIKKKKKLKKKIRDKMAKETLNNLKNKTAMFQSAHEFSYKIDKVDKKEETDKSLKIDDNKIKENTEQINKEKEEKEEKEEKKDNNDEIEEDSGEESFITDE